MEGQQHLSSTCVPSRELLKIHTSNHAQARDPSCRTNQVPSQSMQRWLSYQHGIKNEDGRTDKQTDI